MADYRKVSPKMWGDEKFSTLSAAPPNAQTLWMFLLTGPHTTALPGLSSLGRLQAIEILRWEGFGEAFGEAFDACFAEVSEKCMAKADWKARVVMVPRAIDYNPPESPNVVRYLGKRFDEIPECPLKWEYYQRLRAFVLGLGKGFGEAFGEAFEKPSAKAMPNQYHEQEHKEEVSAEAAADVTTIFELAPATADSPWREVVAHLNAVTGQSFKSTPDVKHRELIEARLRDGYTVAQLNAVIDDKSAEWLGEEKSARWLRPSTLFRKSNFEEYVAQIGRTKRQPFAPRVKSTPLPSVKLPYQPESES